MRTRYRRLCTLAVVCACLAAVPAYAEQSRKTKPHARPRATIASVLGKTRAEAEALIGRARVVKRTERYKVIRSDGGWQWFTNTRFEYHYQVPGFRDVEILWHGETGKEAGPDAAMWGLRAWPKRPKATWRQALVQAGFSTAGAWLEQKVRICGLRGLPQPNEGDAKWDVRYLYTEPHGERMLEFSGPPVPPRSEGSEPERN